MSQGQPGGGRRLRHPHPLGPRRRRRTCADPEPAGDGGRAPSPGARRGADQVRPAGRIGRRARGAPRGAAARLRRRRGQSVPGLREPPRPAAPGPAARGDARPGGVALHQGAEQRRAQGDVEDGHLDAAELLRRPDLRGGRPRPRLRRPLLHRHGVAARRRRPAGDLRGGAATARPGVRAAAGRPGRTGERRRVPVAARRRDPPLQPRDGVQAAARHAQRPVRHLQAVHAAGRRSEPEALHAARPVPPRAARPGSSARRGGAGGGHPAPVLHRRHVVRLDQPGSPRDAGHRHEPHGRPVEHRRRRRGSGAQRAGCQRRLAAQRHQAGGVGPLRRDQRVPGQRRRPADQDGPGRQAR